MDKNQFRQLIRECIVEVITEGQRRICGCGKGCNCSKCKSKKVMKKENTTSIKAPQTPKVRKTWGDMNPTTRVHGQGKQGFKPKYNKRDRNSWKKDLDEGRRVCAWCKKDMGEAPGLSGDTHGVCPACKEKVKKDFSKKKEPVMKEMTSTGAVQGFYGKNWVDPDPKRKRMKSIAAKSVGGKVA